jgi:hypothetical protein
LFGAGFTAFLAAFVALTASARAGNGPLTLAEAAAMPYAPVVKVVDTVSSLGPLATEPQVVTLADLVRDHGHPCDGLLVAAAGIAAVQGLQRRFALAVLAVPPDRAFEVQPLPRFPYPTGEPRPDTAKRACGRVSADQPGRTAPRGNQ